MFQFRRFPAYAYLIQHTLMEVRSIGFPHSDIPGSMLICSSPKLFAAYHVLHRLLMPRHSPCALINLTNALLSAALTSFAEKSISGFSSVSELCRLIKKFSLAEIVSITLKNLFPYCCLLITFLILCSVFKVHFVAARRL